MVMESFCHDLFDARHQNPFTICCVRMRISKRNYPIVHRGAWNSLRQTKFSSILMLRMKEYFCMVYLETMAFTGILHTLAVTAQCSDKFQYTIRSKKNVAWTLATRSLRVRHLNNAHKSVASILFSLNQMRPKVTANETEKYWPKSLQTTYHAVALHASTMTASEFGCLSQVANKTDGENKSGTQPSEGIWGGRREIGHCLTVRWQCGNKHHIYVHSSTSTACNKIYEIIVHHSQRNAHVPRGTEMPFNQFWILVHASWTDE